MQVQSWFQLQYIVPAFFSVIDQNDFQVTDKIKPFRSEYL